MYEEKQGKVLAKIEQFLDAQRQFWYPQSVVIYERKSMYSSFDDMLKREILCTGYLAKEFLVGLELKVSSDWKGLDLLFSYKSEDNGTDLPDKSILEVLRGRGFISNIRFYTEKDKQTEIQHIVVTRQREIAIEKAKKNGVGRVSVYNFFEGSFLYSGRTYKIVGYVEEPELYWLSMLGDAEIGVFSDEGEIRDWLISILSEWLKDKQPIQFNWSSQNKSEKQNESYSLQAFREMSEIGVDASYEEEAHVFRWRDEGCTAQCKSSFLLSKLDAEDIIKKSGLEIPTDAELIGISPYGENTPTPCLMARYVHTIVDQDFDGSSEIPTAHQNPGKIIIEGDFYIFYIDPENRRVISEFRKWRPIKGP